MLTTIVNVLSLSCFYPKIKQTSSVQNKTENFASVCSLCSYFEMYPTMEINKERISMNVNLC